MTPNNENSQAICPSFAELQQLKSWRCPREFTKDKTVYIEKADAKEAFRRHIATICSPVHYRLSPNAEGVLKVLESMPGNWRMDIDMLWDHYKNYGKRTGYAGNDRGRLHGVGGREIHVPQDPPLHTRAGLSWPSLLCAGWLGRPGVLQRPSDNQRQGDPGKRNRDSQGVNLSTPHFSRGLKTPVNNNHINKNKKKVLFLLTAQTEINNSSDPGKSLHRPSNKESFGDPPVIDESKYQIQDPVSPGTEAIDLLPRQTYTGHPGAPRGANSEDHLDNAPNHDPVHSNPGATAPMDDTVKLNAAFKSSKFKMEDVSGRSDKRFFDAIETPDALALFAGFPQSTPWDLVWRMADNWLPARVFREFVSSCSRQQYEWCPDDLRAFFNRYRKGEIPVYELVAVWRARTHRNAELGRVWHLFGDAQTAITRWRGLVTSLTREAGNDFLDQIYSMAHFEAQEFIQSCAMSPGGLDSQKHWELLQSMWVLWSEEGEKDQAPIHLPIYRFNWAALSFASDQ